MDSSIFKIATEIATPLGLTGFVLAVLYLLYRVLLRGQLLSRLGATHSFKIINRMITYVFILAILAMSLGLSAYIIGKLAHTNKGGVLVEPSKKININSELVNYIVISPIVSYGDIFRVKINASSSRVRAFGIFKEQKDKTVKVEAKYNPKKGGIYIDYQVPVNIRLGPQKATIYVQTLQGMKEHQEVVEFNVVAKSDRETNKLDDRLSKSLAMEDLGFVFIKGGTLKMGSNSGYLDEQPIHEVLINSYWIMDHEFTNGDFRKLLEIYPELDLEYKFPELDLENKIMVGDDREINLMPLTFTWKSAREVADKLGKVIEKTVKLPTEAEWEFAARGGLIGKDYSWGNEEDIINGQFIRDIVEEIQYGCSFGMYVHPVKSLFPPNNFKLYDVAGNVWEWTSSAYMDYPYSSTDGREYERRDRFRVIRGGGNAPESCDIRVSFRGYARQNDMYGVRYVIRSN